MDAIVFDIDGTLVDSDEVDGRLFVTAVERVLGVAGIRSDWTSYKHVTDQGILREIMANHGVPLENDVIEATKVEFFSLLSTYVEDHGPFREIPGAVQFVSNLIASEAHYIAYATGAWLESAMIKLGSAGFPTDGIRISTSSEFEDRESIMMSALSDAPTRLESITYYGDGVWDRATSQALGWRFVPVGEALGGVQDYYETAV